MSNGEQRHYSRIPFDGPVTVSGEGRTWITRLVDISLKGLLIDRPADWDATAGTRFALEIPLAPEQVIRMEAIVAHSDQDRVGFRCEHIDVDSISHIRRIVELNLGDWECLNRELHALGGAAPNS